MRHACVVMYVGMANPRWRGKRSIMGIWNYVSEIAFISLGPNELTELVDFPIMPWKPPLFQFCIAPANRSIIVIISYNMFCCWELSLKRIVISFSTKMDNPAERTGCRSIMKRMGTGELKQILSVVTKGKIRKKEKSGQYEKCVI